jgi:phosphatidate cytidylyltransferase
VSVLSIIEFLSITKKFIKNKGNFFLINSLFIIYLSFFVFIVLFFYSGYPAKLILFSILLCCAASDIGGFVFGKLFKGPKLSKISPNKTIAGSLGSIILCSIILTIIFYFLMTNFNFVILIVALLTSISCQIGDLFFSFLKRKAKIKDTGNFLPGHGGVLDRIDGILLGIPVGIFTIILLIK